MNAKRRATKKESNLVTQARRWAKEINCPFYDGVGEIPKSESPYLILLPPDGMFALRVRRTFVEAGVPDDLNSLLDEALAGDWDDLEEVDDSAAVDGEKVFGDIWESRPWLDEPVPILGMPISDFTPHKVANGTASSGTEDRELSSGKKSDRRRAPKE